MQNQFEHFISLWLSHCAVCGDRGHEEARRQDCQKDEGRKGNHDKSSLDPSVSHQESSMKK